MEIKHEQVEFINITATGNALYALDKKGQVWLRYGASEWQIIQMPVYEVK